MQIKFADTAKIELDEAVVWFERQQAGLGRRFNGVIRKAVLSISHAPMLYPVELGEVRRYVVNGFPYVLRYVLRGEDLWIIAVSHQHRTPDYWVDRTT